jgi:AraC-like DNA-binding protein
MDPLSDMLSLLRPRSLISGGFDMGGPWSIQFPRPQGIKCYAVAQGECWLVVEGVDAPVRLATGDCFLLPGGRAFRLCSDLALTPVEALANLPPRQAGGIRVHAGGGDGLVVGGHFILDGDHAGVLRGLLPPIVHIRRDSDREALFWSIERLRQELTEQRPGGALIGQHLAHMMLVQALRAHLSDAPEGGVGWLFALADRQMGAAIGALHAEPARRWTLQDLAEQVGMSRSTFAQRFKETVGTSAMDYLTRWRMLLAGDRLMHSDDPVSAVALSLGYESESAFSTAFKRVMGCPPRRYGREREPAMAAE